jgi:hypothetical protein
MPSSMGSQYGIDVAYFQRRDLQEENGPDGDSWFLVKVNMARPLREQIRF